MKIFCEAMELAMAQANETLHREIEEEKHAKASVEEFARMLLSLKNVEQTFNQIDTVTPITPTEADALLSSWRYRNEIDDLHRQTGAEIETIVDLAIFMHMNNDFLKKHCPRLAKRIISQQALMHLLNIAYIIADTAMDLKYDPADKWEEYKQGRTPEEIFPQAELYSAYGNEEAIKNTYKYLSE